MAMRRQLSPGTRRALQVGAVVCFAVAVFLVGSSILMFAQGFGDLAPGAPPSIDWWLRAVAAFPFFIAGGLMAQFGFLRPVAEIVAGETSGAVEVSAEAAGRGWRTGAGGSASAGIIRLRCRSCGFLDTKDARFCSRCGTPI